MLLSLFSCYIATLCNFMPTLCSPMDCSPPGSFVQGFSRQDYWSGLPFPSPRDLPKPGIEPMFPALADRFFITEPPGTHTHKYLLARLFSFLGLIFYIQMNLPIDSL